MTHLDKEAEAEIRGAVRQALELRVTTERLPTPPVFLSFHHPRSPSSTANPDTAFIPVQVYVSALTAFPFTTHRYGPRY